MTVRFCSALLILLTATTFAQPAPATQPAGDVTLITLQMKQAEPEDIFDALGKAAGVRFSDQGNLWNQDAMQEPIDIDVTNQPFWQVTRDLCAKLKIQPYVNGGQGNNAKRIGLQMAYRDNNWSGMPYVVVNGCLVQATGFNRNQSIQYGSGREGQDSAGVQLMVYLDPALRLATVRGTPKVTEAIDDAGNSLVLQPRKDGMNMGYNGFNNTQGLSVNMQVPLQYPAKPGKKITSMKFNLACRAAEDVQTLTFDKLDQPNQSQTAGDVEIIVKSLKPNKDSAGQYELTVEAKADDRNDLYNLLQSGQLLDAKGHAFNNNGGGGGGGNGTYHYDMNFTKNRNNDDDDKTVGEPTQWVVKLPTKMRTINMPVELKDLPLP